jgi:hypothetical protein
MDEFLSSSHGVPDAPTPISSAGTPTPSYRNAAGDFDLKNKYGSRKVKSRKDSDQPKEGDEPMRDGTLPKYNEGPLATGGTEKDDATKRYFGDFSIEAKRNVMDLLKTHPMFDQKGNMRMGRVQNNTREVMPHDQTKTVENGGYLIRQDQPQASQKSYGTKNHGS